MKRYSFRLEQVLRVRRIEEDRAKAAVTLARRDATLAAAATVDRVAAYRDHRVVRGTISRARFMADRTMHELRAEAVEAARHQELLLADVVQVRMGELSQAAQRVKGLERLDLRRREEYAVEAGRDADRETDDVVTARFERGAR